MISEDECPTMIESWMEKEAQKLATQMEAIQQRHINNIPPWYPPPITPSPVPWGPFPWTPRLSSFDISGCSFENNFPTIPSLEMMPLPKNWWEAIIADLKRFRKWVQDEWIAFTR